MGLMQRVGDYLERAFATGPALVDPGMAAFGIGAETYQPRAYVDYPATRSDVYACIKLRAGSMASVPLKIYTIDAKGQRTELEQGEIIALLRKVNPHWTFRRMMAMTSQSLDVWGECFWAIERRGRKPAELWWMRPDYVTVHPDATDYVRGFTYEVNGKHQFWPREDIVWFRTENVADQFRGLSPLAAARLSADTSHAAMRSNYAIFRNGMNIAGVVSPVNRDVPLSNEQLAELQSQFDKRFKGAEAAHRVALLKFGVDFKQLTMTPQDAEFLGMMDWSMRDIARVYRVPVDKIGGKSTFENLEHSERQYWTDGILPDLTMIAAEITEQLLPQFAPNLEAEFDLSGIDVLHESETAAWEREKGQLETGVLLPNEWREQHGMDPVKWGDVWWAQSTLMPIDSPEKPAPQVPPALMPGTDTTGSGPESDEDAPESTERTYRAVSARVVDYDSPEHRAHWQRQLDRVEPWETRVRATTREQFLSQKQSVLATLRQRGIRAVEELVLEPFDRARWVKAFRVAIRPVLRDVMAESGQLALDDLALATAFDVLDPRVIPALERQANRYAEGINDTTWKRLKTELTEGIANMEGIDQLAARITDLYTGRLEDAEMIARTEVTTATNTATLEGWRQSGVVVGKEWSAALDARTRPTHIEAHGQVVGIDDNFRVGAGTGPSPGSIGLRDEDVRCRCSMVPVLDTEVG